MQAIAPRQQAEIPIALKHFESLPDSAYVGRRVVQALFSCSYTTVWRRVKAGTIPAPRKLSSNANGWNAWNVGELRRVLNQGGENV